MAAGLLARLLPDVAVTSAGLDAPVGEPAAPEAVALLSERGIDYSAHRAIRLSGAQCRAADLILVMSSTQRREVEALHSFTRGRVFSVRAVDGIDVFDPVGLPLDRFRACFALIAAGVEQWAARIEQMNHRCGEAAQ